MVVVVDSEMLSEQSQTDFWNFLSELYICKNCKEDWTVDSTTSLWYTGLQGFTSIHTCKGGVSYTAYNPIPESIFMTCLEAFL